MKKVVVFLMAFAFICFGLSSGIAIAQISHGFEDLKFADKAPYKNLKEHGAELVKRGTLLCQMADEMEKQADAAAWREGAPGYRQYLLDKAKTCRELGEAMIKEGEHMVKEADANLWKEGGPGKPPTPPSKR
ncbi:MAG: hypothetical protein A4E65_01659 [Syntrophorhabdus sp. PtaU1.Bin153]|nr:MAG: hypothetical protein A4E65_01659 [Syntrophorhabdus sp. PtaU1.Bin153]